MGLSLSTAQLHLRKSKLWNWYQEIVCNRSLASEKPVLFFNFFIDLYFHKSWEILFDNRRGTGKVKVYFSGHTYNQKWTSPILSLKCCMFQQIWKVLTCFDLANQFLLKFATLKVSIKFKLLYKLGQASFCPCIYELDSLLYSQLKWGWVDSFLVSNLKVRLQYIFPL